MDANEREFLMNYKNSQNHPDENASNNHNLLILNISFALICVHSRLKTLILTGLGHPPALQARRK
jgi:hypothetical protein